ncbi:hypothetical protein Cgig2_017668 [Carnegiea gigantea]|uniref:Reverse transcriptase zinc-binding domain-containing protein n=1 Tax=Carnegiea gigantea TaxID=171969 RepID=A0A9Q1QBI5_9CARY|nr:hypothetical protein Cgig2_017668 [Carnegiea gigantea]
MDCLGKIGSVLGIPIKTDRYTMERRMLKYARLLIDIPLDAPFLDFAEFINDQDVVVRAPVNYEWKPLKCTHCHMYGHLEDECRKKHKRKVVPTKEAFKIGSALNIRPGDVSRHYSIKLGYLWMLGNRSPQPWSTLIWNRTTLPRHTFTAWLFFHQRVPVRQEKCYMGCVMKERKPWSTYSSPVVGLENSNICCQNGGHFHISTPPISHSSRA